AWSHRLTDLTGLTDASASRISQRPGRAKLAAVAHRRLEASERGCPCGAAVRAAVQADLAAGRDVGRVAGVQAVLGAVEGDRELTADAADDLLARRPVRRARQARGYVDSPGAQLAAAPRGPDVGAEPRPMGLEDVSVGARDQRHRGPSRR